MARQLTKKQREFIDEYLETGNGTQSALSVYDIQSNRPEAVANAIASENLLKPMVVEEITRRINPQLVEDAHKSLLDAVRLDYFVFAKSMDDDEIKTHVESQGLTCVNIRPSEKGKLAFFTLPDGAARGKGIELWHKVQGTFAPDKHVNLNLNTKVEPSPRLRGLADKLNDR